MALVRTVLSTVQYKAAPAKRLNAGPGPNQDGALAMDDHSSPVTPAPPCLPDPDPEGDLQRRFGDRWDIQLEDLGVWSAVHRSEDGRHIRCLVARTPAELLAKLEVAETVEP